MAAARTATNKNRAVQTGLTCGALAESHLLKHAKRFASQRVEGPPSKRLSLRQFTGIARTDPGGRGRPLNRPNHRSRRPNRFDHHLPNPSTAAGFSLPARRGPAPLLVNATGHRKKGLRRCTDEISRS